MIQRAKPNHRRTIRASAIAILIAAGSSISAESVSFAADMPVKAPVYTKAPVAVATQNWSGFYIGGNVGEVQEHSTAFTGMSAANDTDSALILEPAAIKMAIADARIVRR